MQKNLAIGGPLDRKRLNPNWVQNNNVSLRKYRKRVNMSHIKWNDIENFHNLYKGIHAYEAGVGNSVASRKKIAYRPKIKLHGTNAAVQIKNGGQDVLAQSRTSIIGTGNDNCGFAAWVEKNRDIWETFVIHSVDVITVFGEWCGPGIQKGTAINQILCKVFAVFAVQFDDLMMIEPRMLQNCEQYFTEDTFIIPWYNEDATLIEIDFFDKEQIEPQLEKINKWVLEVEECDPWVWQQFDVKGVGEGFVWYPVNLGNALGFIDREALSTYIFKSKGEKHNTVKTSKAALISPEMAESIEAFVDMVATEVRFEQGAREVCRGELSFYNKLIGPFIGWVSKDIKKECQAELEEAGLDWKITSKGVAASARKWYLERLNSV